VKLRLGHVLAALAMAASSCDNAAREHYEETRRTCLDLARGISLDAAIAGFDVDGELVACKPDYAPLGNDRCDYEGVGGACEWAWVWENATGCPGVADACAADPDRCKDRCWYLCVARVQNGQVCASAFSSSPGSLPSRLPVPLMQ
jgi:hypothetical protein